MSNYIFLCEGKLWKEESFFNQNRMEFTRTKYPTYWCRGKPCVGRNEEIEVELNLEEWTINEIAKTLGTTVNQDLVAVYAGWCNRRNELLKRLYCRECSRDLKPEPIDLYRLGHYSIPLFKCVDNNCAEYEEIIRLTHCCNGNCHGMNQTTIDSRDCPKCSQGLLVCQDCYACCKTHHDQKSLCCPKCGKKMIKTTGDNDFSDDENIFWKCENKGCKKSIQDQEISALKNFWARSMDYKDRFREII